MICPVCKSEYTENDKYCTNCGFDQIRKEFINQDELQRWMEETVIPCKSVYKTMAKKLNDSNFEKQPETKEKTVLVENDIIYDDDSVQVAFLKWETKDTKKFGHSIVGTFLFENKTTKQMSIWFKNISIGGFLNQEKSTHYQLPPKLKGMEAFELLYTDRVPDFVRYVSVELAICYGLTEGETSRKKYDSTHESDIISLRFR